MHKSHVTDVANGAFASDSRTRCERSLIMMDAELEEIENHIVRHKPVAITTLLRKTQFTRRELQIMYQGFKQVSVLNVAGQ
ncbi:hypothetical protein EG68_09791 [Paragonimus skrjabini miyazakii]|uniref:Uncharacterized protein n=1 Tax=Paragonimus skrjabini miyazakii TaxID=59628 RepID=A0A8S9YH53_9TREM|nr:hypothetical protein EG68_09791 [Paragonimus skrjabini miyazakii]